MFDVSLTELMVIGVVALIVIGPERLPKVARTVGHLLGRAQRYVNDVKSDIQREIELDELRKFKSEMETAAQGVQKSLHETQASLEEPVQQLRASWTKRPARSTASRRRKRPPPTRPRRCPRRRLPQVRLPQVRLPQDRLPLSPPPNPRAPSRRPRRTPIWPWTSAPSRHRPQRPPRRRPANPRPPPSPPRPRNANVTQDASQQEDGQQESFISHLIELRSRLLRAAAAIVAVFIVLFIYPGASPIYDALAQPMLASLPQGTRMIATGVITPFMVPVKVTMMAAFIIALPVVLYQAWAFVAPGLYRHESGWRCR